MKTALDMDLLEGLLKKQKILRGKQLWWTSLARYTLCHVVCLLPLLLVLGHHVLAQSASHVDSKMVVIGDGGERIQRVRILLSTCRVRASNLGTLCKYSGHLARRR